MGGEEGGVHRGVVDSAAGERGPGEHRHVEVRRERRLRRKETLPQARTGGHIRAGELDDDTEPAREGHVEVVAHVRRQHARAVMALDPRQEVRHLEVRVSVAGVPDLATAPEQAVSLVELKDDRPTMGGVEQLVQVLLGLPDVLADEPSEVGAVQRPVQLGGEDAGRERLAGSRRAAEQRDGAAAEPPAPLLCDQPTVPDMGHELFEDRQLLVGQHKVIPRGARGHASCAGRAHRLIQPSRAARARAVGRNGA